VVPYGRALALVLPHRGVAEVLVVALGFAVILPFLAEVAAARLAALERVAAQQLAELEEVGDAAGLLQLLVEFGAAARHAHLLMS